MNKDINDYKEKVKKARDIVEELKLEEPYKTNAFNTLLKDMLRKNEPTQQKEESKIESSPNKEDNDAAFNLQEMPYFEGCDKLDWKNKLISILQWAKHNHPEKGLLSSEFVRVFHERFSMPYIDSGKINKEITRRLLRTPLITRKKVNQKDFRWFITPKGEEYLKKEERNEIQS